MYNWKNKKVIITGANGFIGTNATWHFDNLGAKVTAFVSPKKTKKKFKVQNISIQEVNLLSPEQTEQAIIESDIIFHFAGIDGNAEFKKLHSAEIFSKNIRMTLNLLEAAVKKRVKTFFFVSSADIYTPSNHRLITEKSSLDIHWDANMDGYKLAKWSQELAAREFSKQYGMNIIIVRPSNIYGPYDEFNNLERMRVIPAMIKKIYETNDPLVVWGKKNQIRSFLYVKDFLLICQELVEKGSYNQPITIASKQEINLGDLAKMISDISGKKRKVIIDRKKGAGIMTRRFNLTLLERLLPNFEETPLQEGLLETINFYNNKLSFS